MTTTKNPSQNLYQSIGFETIRDVVTEFYLRAFDDPIIGHFFFKKDHDSLVVKQIEFTCLLLGSQEHSYSGRPLKEVHSQFMIGTAHFMRRQQLLITVMAEHNLPQQTIDRWIQLESQFMAQIIGVAAPNR